SGYIFTTLLEAILQVGGATAISLRTETRAFLACLSKPIHIQIFVTADDEHCPATVVLAHAFAYASPALVVDTIEVRAFPELIEQHGVTQTPTVVIDKQVVFSGAVTEAELLWQLRRVATSCY
ncbi:MAG: glutaredoxin, partial [Oscillochloris sp.]|nr:glutaredoxin [Oscillochloris sp.]